MRNRLTASGGFGSWHVKFVCVEADALHAGRSALSTAI
jgi:hypothetical protein